MENLLTEIEEILKGIDEAEGSMQPSDSGWWETSTGAEFGAGRLRLIREAFARHGDRA